MADLERLYFKTTSASFTCDDLIREYLNDKFLEFKTQNLPILDNGDPCLGKRKKKRPKGFQYMLDYVSSKMLRTVVLPGMNDIAQRYKMKARIAHYIPKKGMMRMVKIQVY